MKKISETLILQVILLMLVSIKMPDQTHEESEELKRIPISGFEYLISPDGSDFECDIPLQESLVHCFRNIFAMTWQETWYAEDDPRKTTISLEQIAAGLQIAEPITDIAQIENHPGFAKYKSDRKLVPFHDPASVREHFETLFRSGTPSVILLDAVSGEVAGFAITGKQKFEEVIEDYENAMSATLPQSVKQDFAGIEVINFAELGLDFSRFRALDTMQGVVFTLFGGLQPYFKERIIAGIDDPRTPMLNWTALKAKSAPLILGAGFVNIWHNDDFIVSQMSLLNYVELFNKPKFFREDGTVNPRVAYVVLQENSLKSAIANGWEIASKVFGPKLLDPIKKFLGRD